MIRAVIFDVGGVLVRTEDRGPRAAWERRLSLGEGAADEVVFHSHHGWRAQHGEIDDAELWTWVGERLDLSADDLRAFRRDFWAGDALDRELVAYIESLRPAYQAAIISNATSRLRHTLQTDYPIADAFDLIVCSAEEGVMKPAATIYQRTVERLGRRPEEAVFIDDSPANVAGARAAGLHAILFTTTAELIPQLEALGVTPEDSHE